MTTFTFEPLLPQPEEVALAAQASPRLRGYLTQHTDAVMTVRVIDDGPSEPLALPRAAVELLSRIMAHMAQGQAISIVPAHAELTTQQAADLLNVSRPYLIELLDRGEIQYRRVGTHRRILAASLMTYMSQDDARRRQAADELTALGQEMGLI